MYKRIDAKHVACQCRRCAAARKELKGASVCAINMKANFVLTSFKRIVVFSQEIEYSECVDIDIYTHIHFIPSSLCDWVFTNNNFIFIAWWILREPSCSG